MENFNRCWFEIRYYDSQEFIWNCCNSIKKLPSINAFRNGMAKGLANRAANPSSWWVSSPHFAELKVSQKNVRRFKHSGGRKSHQLLNEVYFWTTVIKDWNHLLQEEEMKMIIIESFQWLVQHELVFIYGYVIRPNHIHVVWEQLKMNNKKTPKESFEKNKQNLEILTRNASS